MKTRLWRWLRTPTHDNMRVIDLITCMVWMVGILIVQRTLTDSDWVLLLFLPGIIIPIYLTKRYVPNAPRRD